MVVTMVLRDVVHSNAYIVLASASPRRRALLRLLGVSFDVQAADIDETPRPGESPDTLTQRLARSKALAVSRKQRSSNATTGNTDNSQLDAPSGRGDSSETSADVGPTPDRDVVLAADTVVVLDDRILGKPRDDVEAASMLEALRGRTHCVLTGVAVAVAGEIRWTGVVETKVWMRVYGDDEIEWYVRSGTPRDRAGAYGIQDADFRPVTRIEGCLANAVGLPLCHVRQALTAIDPARAWGPNWEAASGEDDCRVCKRALDV